MLNTLLSGGNVFNYQVIQTWTSRTDSNIIAGINGAKATQAAMESG